MHQAVQIWNMLTKHVRNRSRWGIGGVLIGLGLGLGCSKEAEIKPTYRFEGRVVLAGTGQSPGQSLNVLVCALGPAQGYDTLARIPTDDSGYFMHTLSTNLVPGQLRLRMDSMPPDFVQPSVMPAISGYGMTQLRIEIPAKAWLRIQFDLTGMTPGGLLSVLVGMFSEFYYNPGLIVRTYPWVSGSPLSVEGSYSSGPTATPQPLDTVFVLEPLRVTEWTWVP